MEKSNNSNVIMELEDKYPQHDRRAQGWKLEGFVDSNKKNQKPKNSFLYPYGAVPIWRYIGWGMNDKYTGQKLREIRASGKYRTY